MDRSTPAIRIEGLTKDYGSHRALDGLDLQVEQGEIFGFLGPNGSGKTTTIRLLLDLIRPTSGRATLLGFDCQRESHLVRAVCGYLPGEVRLFSGRTGEATVRFFASLRNEPGNLLVARSLAERLELDLSGHVSAYSKGTRQKLGFILALMHRPTVLLLDEPTGGLDPLMQLEVWKILRDEAATGTAVFFSSHVMSEVEQVCQRVGILRAGRLAAVEPISQLKGRSLRRIEVGFDVVPPIDALSGHGVREVGRRNETVVFEVESGLDAFIKSLGSFNVTDLRTEQPTLEEILLTYYREGAR